MPSRPSLHACANTSGPSADTGLAEPDAGGAMDEPRQRVAPLLERAIAKIDALEVEEVENDE